ncbi:TPA: restriction endonuclease subunit S [Enterococcus faecium]|nr:restriction endonuclease subunit S [Enterococcus faecium]NTR74487.1 restriction endonuclease subunit S [Enterococcus faecium]HAR1346393.1 restriction endonuclease subunit S [Enterococcus faecium]HAR1378088.1 restriction endonuclease subunit S [Enterococcus faecium]HAR1397565.1 restriction endonuclease subunit S [Enterococcus faecium]
MSNDTQPEIRFPGFTDEWEQRKLGELATIVRGASPRPIQDPKWFDTESDVGWLRIADVTEQDGRIYYLEQHISKLGQEKTRVLVEPHLLLSIAATVGKPVVNYVKTGVHDGFLIFLNAIFDREFMFQWLEMFRPKWQKYGQPGSQVNLNSELVRNQEILIPNNEEQQKIGSFFKQLDNTIALHQRKLDLLKETKKGFLQKMFPKNGAKVPEIRFPGFTEDWEQRKLGDIFKKDIQKNKDLEFNSDSVISVAKMKLSTPSAKSSDEYMKTYNKIWKGNIAFEGHTNDEFPNGRFVLNDCQDGIVSHIYDVYSAVDEYDNEFMKRYINNPYVMRKILINATSSARMMKSLNSVEFLKQSILLPILSEQQKIGGFFYQLDNIIALHQRKLDLLKETKKGFLQKMFV